MVEGQKEVNRYLFVDIVGVIDEVREILGHDVLDQIRIHDEQNGLVEEVVAAVLDAQLLELVVDVGGSWSEGHLLHDYLTGVTEWYCRWKVWHALAFPKSVTSFEVEHQGSQQEDGGCQNVSVPRGS